MTSGPARAAAQFSCRLEMLPGDTVRRKLDSAAAFGFDAVGIPGRFLAMYRRGLAECAGRGPVAYDTISLGFRGSLLSPRRADRLLCRDSLLRLMDLAAGWGVAKLNVPPMLTQDNPRRIRTPGRYASLDARFDALLQAQLPALAGEAAARGLRLLLEPVNRYESDYLHTVGHAAALCATLAHPALGVTADFFHMQIEELSIPRALLKAGPWVRHVHVAENTRVEPGPGSLDFTPGFRALKTASYRGAIEIECRRLSGPPERVLPRACRRLKALWRRAQPLQSARAGDRKTDTRHQRPEDR